MNNIKKPKYRVFTSKYIEKVVSKIEKPKTKKGNSSKDFEEELSKLIDSISDVDYIL